MSLRDLAFVGLRLIAIFLALNVVHSIAAVAQVLVTWSDDRVPVNPFIYYGAISSAIYLLLSACLWFTAGRLSALVAPFGAPTKTGDSPRMRELQVIAFSAVGLFVLVGALPKLAGELHRLYFLANAITISPETTLGDVARRIQIGVEMLLGVSLLLGGGAFAGMLARFREVGLPPVSETSNNTPHSDARDAETSTSDGGTRAGGRAR